MTEDATGEIEYIDWDELRAEIAEKVGSERVETARRELRAELNASVADADVRYHRDPINMIRKAPSVVERRDEEVTRRVASHLKIAAKVRRESVGSITGTIGSITVKGRNVAGLWPDRGGPRVQLWFTDQQMPALRDALASRAQVSGLIRRNMAGQAIGVTVDRLELLPSRSEDKPVTGIIGLAPSLTGDRPTLAFLDEIRGTS